jgi:hypothetical protein
VNRERRKRLNALERVVSRYAATEERLLADLRLAGWNFNTIEAARKRLKAENTIAGLSDEERIERLVETL